MSKNEITTKENIGGIKIENQLPLIMQNVKGNHEGNRFDSNIKSKRLGISKINAKGDILQPHVT